VQAVRGGALLSQQGWRMCRRQKRGTGVEAGVRTCSTLTLLLSPNNILLLSIVASNRPSGLYY